MQFFTFCFVVASVSCFSECFQFTPTSLHASLLSITSRLNGISHQGLAHSFEKRCQNREFHDIQRLPSKSILFIQEHDAYSRYLTLTSAKRSVNGDRDDFDGRELFDDDDDDEEDLLSLESSDFVLVGSSPASVSDLIENLGMMDLRDSSSSNAASTRDHQPKWGDINSNLRTQSVPPRSIVEAASLRHRQKAARTQISANTQEHHSSPGLLHPVEVLPTHNHEPTASKIQNPNPSEPTDSKIGGFGSSAFFALDDEMHATDSRLGQAHAYFQN
jgi:hypothetical protein